MNWLQGVQTPNPNISVYNLVTSSSILADRLFAHYLCCLLSNNTKEIPRFFISLQIHNVLLCDIFCKENLVTSFVGIETLSTNDNILNPLV
jgi:hypothetical protein